MSLVRSQSPLLWPLISFSSWLRAFSFLGDQAINLKSLFVGIDLSPNPKGTFDYNLVSLVRSQSISHSQQPNGLRALAYFSKARVANAFVFATLPLLAEISSWKKRLKTSSRCWPKPATAGMNTRAAKQVDHPTMLKPSLAHCYNIRVRKNFTMTVLLCENGEGQSWWSKVPS